MASSEAAAIRSLGGARAVVHRATPGSAAFPPAPGALPVLSSSTMATSSGSDEDPCSEDWRCGDGPLRSAKKKAIVLKPIGSVCLS